MVGDSAVDMQTARNAGVIGPAACAGGFSQKRSLLPRPDFLIDDMRELIGKTR